MTDIMDPSCPNMFFAAARESRWDMGDLYDVVESTLDDLPGKICIAIDKRENSLAFLFHDGTTAHMHHEQSCCETVSLEDVVGDLDDLIGHPIAIFDERHQKSETEEKSSTWTFYTLRTIRGTVDLRWYGTSNGYYSERAQIDVYTPRTPLSHHQCVELAAATRRHKQQHSHIA